MDQHPVHGEYKYSSPLHATKKGIRLLASCLQGFLIFFIVTNAFQSYPTPKQGVNSLCVGVPKFTRKNIMIKSNVLFF